MNSRNFMVALATNKGAYFLTPDDERKKWEASEPFLATENVNKVVDDRNGNMFAATFTEGVFKSTDGGRTWKPSSKGLHVRKVWEIAPDPHHQGTVYAGTQYGHLFKSLDSGDSWEEVASLHDAPDRLNWGIDWGYRTTGLALHTIRFDPENPEIIYLVASGNGTYRSDDGGESWKSLKNGLNSSCSIENSKLISSASSGSPPAERLSKHLAELHSCTHKIVVSPKDGRVYQQNHCGIYFSGNHGDRWEDVSIDSDNRFGFAVDVLEDESTHVIVIPVPEAANDCKEHNACIRGQLSVYSTSDGGKNWTRHSDGLPVVDHSTVLRDCLAHDNERNPGLYMGTTTGEALLSTDFGKTWRNMGTGFGRIQGVNVVMP